MNSVKRRLVSLIALGAVMLLMAPAALALDMSSSGNIASGAQYDLYTVSLTAGENIVATLVCDFDGVSRPLDPVLSVYFPGTDPSDTINADVYNDDGFGKDDDPNGVDCNAFDSSRVRFGAPVTGVYTFRADGFGSSTGPYTLEIHSSLNPLARDGRINPQGAAQQVLYCDETTTLVYSVNGQVLGSVENGGTTSGAGWTLAPHVDGRMLFASTFPDGKAYYVVYTGCPAGTYYALSGDPAQVFDQGGYGQVSEK
jgi:hypothetical protein